MKSAFKNLICLLLISVICGSLLGVVYRFTKTDASTVTDEAVLNAVGISISQGSVYDITSQIEIDSTKIKNIYLVKSNVVEKNNTIVIVANGTGFARGVIDLLVAVNVQDKIIGISKISTLDLDKQSWWQKNKYDNKILDYLGPIKQEYSVNDIDGYTGATRSANAITEAMNNASSLYYSKKSQIRGVLI